MRFKWLGYFWTLATLSATAAFAEGVSTADILRHENGLWSLEPVSSIRRWIVIHNLRGADEGTVLHIEVLARNHNAPAWQVDHLAPHIAITMAALSRSVRTPLMRGGVYPESFDYALRHWTEQRRTGLAPVCTTTVDRCLKDDW
jgi:hypothetical protein